MKTQLIKYCFFIAITPLLFAACDDDEVTDPLLELYGTWVTNEVSVSGYGIFDGTVTIKFNEDKSYRNDVDWKDEGSACEVVLHYLGNFSGDETTLTITPTSGEVVVSGCSDDELNQESRAYTNEEIAAAASTVEWIVSGNNLELIHSDGLERIYQRQ